MWPRARLWIIPQGVEWSVKITDIGLFCRTDLRNECSLGSFAHGIPGDCRIRIHRMALSGVRNRQASNQGACQWRR
jgi:hypothetical protein